jgi:nucleoside recognition membrane protein YjiH
LKFLFDIPLPFWIYTQWFITYLVPIPAWLFVEQFLGKGWKSSIRRLLQIQIAVSIFAIAVSGYLDDPAAAMVANNMMASIGILVVLANLFQPNLSCLKNSSYHMRSCRRANLQMSSSGSYSTGRENLQRKRWMMI